MAILRLTRRDIEVFVECEQDRGIQPVSEIGHLRAFYGIDHPAKKESHE